MSKSDSSVAKINHIDTETVILMEHYFYRFNLTTFLLANITLYLHFYIFSLGQTKNMFVSGRPTDPKFIGRP